VYSDIPLEVHVLDADVAGWGPDEEIHRVFEPDSNDRESVDEAIIEFESEYQKQR